MNSTVYKATGFFFSSRKQKSVVVGKERLIDGAGKGYCFL